MAFHAAEEYHLIKNNEHESRMKSILKHEGAPHHQHQSPS